MQLPIICCQSDVNQFRHAVANLFYRKLTEESPRRSITLKIYFNKRQTFKIKKIKFLYMRIPIHKCRNTYLDYYCNTYKRKRIVGDNIIHRGANIKTFTARHVII